MSGLEQFDYADDSVWTDSALRSHIKSLVVQKEKAPEPQRSELERVIGQGVFELWARTGGLRVEDGQGSPS